MERLQNILAHAGVASRRGAAALIESGAVTVDGIVVREPGARFEDGVQIKVNGKVISAEEKHRTIVLYKPVGVLSTMSDPFGGKTVAELVRTPERLVPVEVVCECESNVRLLKFVLGEGRKRQIRKMCSAAHLVVLELKRVAVGRFQLPPELKPGEWRDLTEDEVRALRADA